MRPARLVPALVAFAAVIVASAPARSQQFRSTADLVRLPVAVVDRSGMPVRGLTTQDFVVYDNGRRQEIVMFAEGASGDDPLHLGIMLDKSQSMELDLPAASAAAIRFVNALDEARDVTLVDFDSSVRIGQFKPPDYPQLFARVRDRRVGDTTLLFDALNAYAARTRETGGLHVLVMYTDGVDSRSRSTFPQVVETLRATSAIVYAVGYMGHISPAHLALRYTQQLQNLARETGGEAFFPSGAREIDGFYGRILGEIQSRYTLGYLAPDPDADGRVHKIAVRLARPAFKDVKVRSRLTYVTPRR